MLLTAGKASFMARDLAEANSPKILMNYGVLTSRMRGAAGMVSLFLPFQLGLPACESNPQSGQRTFVRRFSGPQSG